MAARSPTASCSPPGTPCRWSTAPWPSSTRPCAPALERTGDERFAFPDDGEWALTWEHLLRLRRRGGLAGHAEMEGKTLFLKFNTGPSGHGMPPAAGEAAALKLAGAGEVKVFVVEGEGGLTPGASHETRNTAWGLGLDNLVFLVDWNDYGIDDAAIQRAWSTARRPTGSAPYGWRITGTEQGSEWGPVTRAVLEAARGENPDRVPVHGLVQDAQGPRLRQVRQQEPRQPARHELASRSGRCARSSWPATASSTPASTRRRPRTRPSCDAQARHNFEVAHGRAARQHRVVDAITDRLLELAASVPEQVEGFHLGGRGADIFSDSALHRCRRLPRLDVEEARREGAQPRRAGHLGRVGQRHRARRSTTGRW